MKVFLVDDSELIRFTLRSLFSAIPGLEIVGEALDSDEAIGDILRTSPDLVILDLRLQRGSGFSVLKAVKLLRPATRVYVLTNHAHHQYRDRALAAGADRFLDKSSDIDCLLDLISGTAT